MPQSPLDPDAVNLAKAIRQTESGGNFSARGKSGEYGAYQYTPDTWAKDSTQFGVNAQLEQATPEQQNEVAYKKVKSLKDQGYNPGQIASIWNSGKPDAYLDPNYKGVNKNGAKFDVPAYAQSVATAYHTIKQGGSPGIDPQNPSSTANVQNQAPQEQGLGGKLLGRLNDASTALSSKEINPLSKIVQTAGAAAGGVGDVVTSGLELIPGFKQLEGAIGAGAGKLAETPQGQKVVQGYNKFSTEHPELSKDLSSAVDIASLIPIVKGAGIAKNVIGSTVKKSLVGGTDAVLETVAPKLTAKETAQAIAQRGTSNKGLLQQTALNPDPKVQQIAEVVKKNVPGFDPSKGFLHNIKVTQDTVGEMARNLKREVLTSGANIIYPKRELLSRLRKLEKPDLIASDTTLNNVYDRLIKRVEALTEQKGGKISNLLDLRQEFDALVKRQYPNLYSSETLTPLRAAVKDIRESITGFTAENLPNVALRESLLTQHQLITAIENMAEKAAKTGSELGTNAATRLAGRHPVISGLIKTIPRAAVEGTGIGAVLRLMQ